MYHVVCYGDSNTWGVNTKQNLIRLSPEKRWTQVAARILGEDYRIIEEGLQGRTTVFDDPFGYGRNGEKYLDIAVLSHDPINLLVIMLGTNDMKEMFRVTAEDSAWGIERIIIRAQNLFSQCCGGKFKILVVSPIHLTATASGNWYYGFTENSVKKSQRLAGYYKLIAEKYKCAFLDAADYAKASILDGVHIANEDHKILGEAMADKIRMILESDNK